MTFRHSVRTAAFLGGAAALAGLVPDALAAGQKPVKDKDKSANQAKGPPLDFKFLAQRASDYAPLQLKKLDPKIAGWLDLPLAFLLFAEQDHTVFEAKYFADPGSITTTQWRGTLLLGDPSREGSLVPFNVQRPDGSYALAADGQPLVTWWYQTPDGRISQILRTPAGDGFGTVTLDLYDRHYEVALDLDGDRRVDFLDTMPADQSEQVIVTSAGLGFMEAWMEGYNPLCFAPEEGGPIGSGLGAGADPRTGVAGCGLRHPLGNGSSYGGSLGHPGSTPTPLDTLCAGLGGGTRDQVPERFRDMNRGYDPVCDVGCGFSMAMDLCTFGCKVEATVTLLSDPSLEGLINSTVEHSECAGDCVSSILIPCVSACERERGHEPPPPPALPEPPPSVSPSDPAHEEDTDGDGVPDASCSPCSDDGAGAGGSDPGPSTGGMDGGVHSRPDPDDGVVGSFDLFCGERESGVRARWMGDIDPRTAACDPAVNPAPAYREELDEAAFACLGAPEVVDIDDVVRGGRDANCAGYEGGGRGCEPDVRGEMRARFAAFSGLLVGFEFCNPMVCSREY